MSARSAAASATSVLALLLAGCGGGGSGPTPPAADATTLVPADALVYVHVSLDTGRGATQEAATLARRFPGFATARRSLLARLSAPGCRIPRRTGREAALALLPGQGGGAVTGSLVLVDTGREAKGTRRPCGRVAAQQIGRFLALGQPETLDAAAALAAGRGRALSALPAYRRALDALPADRVADAWATGVGVRRLLAPQPGLLGIAGTLLDQPGLTGAAASLSADGRTRARLVVRSQLRRGSGGTAFRPSLQDSVPADALAVLQARGLSVLAGRLLPALGQDTAALAPLLARAGKDLGPLARLFAGEVAVVLQRGRPSPVLSLVTRTTDEAGASATLGRTRPLIARLLGPSGGPAPTWTRDGAVWRLRPAAGIEVAYAVADGRIVVSTRSAAAQALTRVEEPLADSDAFRAGAPDLSTGSTSVGFLDFNQLLRQGEQAGLDDIPSFRAALPDLRKLSSAALRTSGTGDEPTAELLLSIP